MVQLDIIDKIKNEWLKGDKYRILVVFYYNNKVLGMNICDGQVEYFGKKGTIILISMEVQWEEISDGSQSQGFCYYYFDCVIKSYTRQYHIQLGAVVYKMKHIFKETNPRVKEMCTQSDNVT